MYKTIVVACLCIPGICIAQTDKLDFGLSVPLYVKYNTQSGMDRAHSLLGTTGLDVLVKINGTGETDMAFQMAAGIRDDARTFGISENSPVKTGLYFLNINPSVVIPARRPHRQYNLGIGALVRLGQNISMASSSSSIIYGYTTVDTLNKIINSTSRSVVPYVSFGIIRDIKKHWKVQLTMEATLLNFYESGTSFLYKSNTTQYDIELDYQPIYVGVKLFYLFRSTN